MTLARTGDLIAAAVSARSAVLAFNVITLEHAQGIVGGLEHAGAAGILQVSENAVHFHHGRMEPLLAACRELADEATVPVAIHLDHFQDAALTAKGIRLAARLGVTSVMVDAAHLPYTDNVAATAALAQTAHREGLWVEAELGAIGGKAGAHTPGVRTDPEEARDFVERTGVDGLAVAVGSTHAMTSAGASVDIGLLERLAALVPVPLVLHGSSGVTPDSLGAAVRAGIRKVNVGTALNVAYTGEIRRLLDGDARVTDPRAYLAGARDAVSESVLRLCSLVRQPSPQP
ncbi:MAG TPA: class II fructose-bisphosphate aldolase [Cellulomonas sp.]|uniref:class II fructose-bisphosphate aldolase n=1 Tax=Cellulomonas sp. TaxID=40001 RepID=UPI002E2FD9FA|nr:class II fructose-bisphosphate aldolase [Cellulomonas sp.]HEX5333429.1 class II fructose-bisphosphate aldolase [Cellulomonas sp.]